MRDESSLETTLYESLYESRFVRLILGFENTGSDTHTNITPYTNVTGPGENMFHPPHPTSSYQAGWDKIIHVRLSLYPSQYEQGLLNNSLIAVIQGTNPTGFHPSFVHESSEERSERHHLEFPFVWYDTMRENNTLYKVTMYPDTKSAWSTLERSIPLP